MPVEVDLATTSGSSAKFEFEGGDGTPGNSYRNRGIGQSLTTVAADGDLQAIDTDAEALSADPTANTSGAASAVRSSTFLFRWLIRLVQYLINTVLGLQTDSASATGSISAKLRQIATLLAGALITVSRTPLVSTTTVTRPADVIGYTGSTSSASGDAISSSTSSPADIVFTNCVLVNGGSARLESASLFTSQTAFAGAVRLHLFNSSATPTKTNDNAQLTIDYTSASYIGYVDFQGASPGSTGAYLEGVISSIGSKTFTANASTTSLFALIEVRAAFTPLSTQTFKFTLTFDPI